MKLTTHLRLVLGLRKSEIANLLHLWHGQRQVRIYICSLGSGSNPDMCKSSEFKVCRMGLFCVVGESVLSCVN